MSDPLTVVAISNSNVSVEEIFSVLRKGYHEKIGKDVNIDIKEVEKVSKKGPRIVSNVDKTKFKIKQYI